MLEVVVCSTKQTKFSCLIKIFIEIFVKELDSFCGFDEDEADALISNLCFGEFVPIDVSLVMTDVDSANGISVGIVFNSVECSPA